MQDRTPPRLLSPWISNRCRLRATAIATECVGPDRQPARTTARATQRCSLQRSLNDVPYGWNLAHSLGLDDDCVWSDLAKAYEKLDPIAVLPVHTRLVERELADADARRYRGAARRLKKMRKLAAGSGESAQVDEFIGDLRERYRRRPRLQLEFDRAGLP